MTAMCPSRSSALVGALAVLLAACTSAAPPPKPKATGFVRADGTRLVLDGKPYRFHGLNYYDMNSIDGENPFHPGFTMSRKCRSHFETPDLNESLANIGSAANALRAWFFQPYAVSVPIRGGRSQRDWSVFDNTLAAVKRAGMKVIVTLTNQHGVCDLPDGAPKSLDWYRAGYRTEVAPTLVSTYREYVREIATRYRDHNEILMWQLVNEASANDEEGNCHERAAARALRSFADDVGGLVKSLDPNHLVSLGSGVGGCGVYGTNRSDYKDVHASPGIDICEYHDYGDPYSPLPRALRRELALCRALNKPLFVGEVGMAAADVSAGCPVAARFVACRSRLLKKKLDDALGAPQEAAVSSIVGELVWTFCEPSWTRCAPRDFDVVPADPVLAVLAELPVS